MDMEQNEKSKTLQQNRLHFVKRVIAHRAFHNLTYKEAERMLSRMDQGEAIVRPSAKATDHLTVTWKVAGGIYQHVNIRETQKAKVFDIGKVLYINNEPYEDLDEILARYIQPMAAYARDIMSYKYYMEGVNAEDTTIIESHLKDEKKLTPAKIPYTLTPSQKFPGRFVLSYFFSQKVRHEYMTTTPEGIRFRNQQFGSTDELINWFKQNCATPRR